MTTKPVLNVPLLTKVLDHITANPEEWNQRVFAEEATCGTAACVAGWAAIMTGHTLKYDIGYLYGTERPFAKHTAEGEFIGDVACRELGLTETQGAALFHSTNDLNCLWKLADIFSNGEIQRLDEVSA